MNNTPNPQERKNEVAKKATGALNKNKSRALDFMMIIVCFLIACVVWIYVAGIENGEYEYTFTDVPVSVDGASSLLHEKGLSLVTDHEYTVDITVKGYRREIMKYSSDDFFAHIDVGSIATAGKHSLNVDIDAPAGNMKIVSATPSILNILVDETATKQIPIKIALRYDVADSITMSDPIPEVDTIEIMGPKSKIDLIEYAKVEYDLGTVTTSKSFRASIILCDDLGYEIASPYVRASMNEVSVKVKATATSAVSIAAEFTANDSNMYDYKVTFYPESLMLEGDPADISRIESLKVNIGDISSRTSGKISVDQIKIPENVVIANRESVSGITYAVEKTPKNQG